MGKKFIVIYRPSNKNIPINFISMRAYDERHHGIPLTIHDYSSRNPDRRWDGRYIFLNNLITNVYNWYNHGTGFSSGQHRSHTWKYGRNFGNRNTKSQWLAISYDDSFTLKQVRIGNRHDRYRNRMKNCILKVFSKLDNINTDVEANGDLFNQNFNGEHHTFYFNTNVPGRFTSKTLTLSIPNKPNISEISLGGNLFSDTEKVYPETTQDCGNQWGYWQRSGWRCDRCCKTLGIFDCSDCNCGDKTWYAFGDKWVCDGTNPSQDERDGLRNAVGNMESLKGNREAAINRYIREYNRISYSNNVIYKEPVGDNILVDKDFVTTISEKIAKRADIKPIYDEINQIKENIKSQFVHINTFTPISFTESNRTHERGDHRELYKDAISPIGKGRINSRLSNSLKNTILNPINTFINNLPESPTEASIYDEIYIKISDLMSIQYIPTENVNVLRRFLDKNFYGSVKTVVRGYIIKCLDNLITFYEKKAKQFEIDQTYNLFLSNPPTLENSKKVGTSYGNTEVWGANAYVDRKFLFFFKEIKRLFQENRSFPQPNTETILNFYRELHDEGRKTILPNYNAAFSASLNQSANQAMNTWFANSGILESVGRFGNSFSSYIVRNVGEIGEAVQEYATSLVQTFDDINDFFDSFHDIHDVLGNTLKEMLDKNPIKQGIDKIKDMFDKVETLSNVATNLPSLIKEIPNTIKSKVDPIIETEKENLKTYAENKRSELFSYFNDKLVTHFNNFGSGLTTLLQNLLNHIINLIKEIIRLLTELLGILIGGLNKILQRLLKLPVVIIMKTVELIKSQKEHFGVFMAIRKLRKLANRINKVRNVVDAGVALNTAVEDIKDGLENIESQIDEGMDKVMDDAKIEEFKNIEEEKPHNKNFHFLYGNGELLNKKR